MELNRNARVVIADDHAPTRALVRRVLETADCEVCAEAFDADGALGCVLQHRPDAAVLDISMPGNGVRAARDIGTTAKSTAVIMLTVSHDSDDLYEALRAGASGYVLKGADLARLPQTIWGVLAGEAILPTSLIHRMIGEFQRRQRHRLAIPGGRAPRLTEREWEVLELLADGFGTAEIGPRLFIAPVTVRSHIASILHKLRVGDRASAVALVQASRNHALDDE